MPISTPNRVADPVVLERFDSPGLLRQAGEIYINYYNTTGLTILAGEPVIHAGAICIAAEAILPAQQGTVYQNWLVDFIVDVALNANILANDSVWWSYDVTPITGFSGGVVNAAPTNGFILGRAVVPPGTTRLNGSSKPIAATVDDVRVRVISVQEPVVVIGTVPVFN